MLTPNDMGVVDFAGVAVTVEPDRLVIDRGGDPLVYRRTGS